MDKLYIVMPAYNEEENIEAVVKQWYPLLTGVGGYGSELIVADSGSTDSTHEILVKMQADMPKLKILSDTAKQHGPKLIALYDYSIRNEADFVFQTDSDGQTNPDEFESFWNKRNEYDAIFGYRDERGDGKIRALVEDVVCILLRFYFCIKVPDANAPFRLMNTKVLKKYLYKMPKDYNIPNIIITAYFVRFKEKYLFEKISFKSRQFGTNSINIPKIIKIGWKALSDFNYFRKDMNKERADE